MVSLLAGGQHGSRAKSVVGWLKVQRFRSSLNWIPRSTVAEADMPPMRRAQQMGTNLSRT